MIKKKTELKFRIKSFVVESKRKYSIKYNQNNKYYE